MRLQNYSKYLLIIIAFLAAIVVRWWFIPGGAISFAYDQARDGFIVQELLQGDLKLLGPSVSGVPGLAHGVLYYYLIAPAYYFGHGDPRIVAYFLSFMGALGVFTTFSLSFLLTKKVLPSILSAFIFAFSFESVQYANLLTNASMGVWFTPLVYIGLYLWIKKAWKWSPIFTGLSLGLAVQSEVALAYHFAPIIFWLSIFRKEIKLKDVLISGLSFLVAVSTMIASEVKFGFPGIKGVLYLLGGQDQISGGKELSDFISIFLNQTGKTFAFNIFPLNIVFGGILGFFMLIYSTASEWGIIKKEILTWQTFLASYILAHFLALPFGGTNMRHLMVGAGVGIAVFTGIFISKYFSKNKIIFAAAILMVIGSNIYKTFKENINGQTIFPLQLDLVLSKELKAIDYTYMKADGKPFSISTLTSPLHVNTLWSYLYNWYGKEKYGYIPYWVGRDQVGTLGNNLGTPPSNVTNHFFIIEPTYGIPELWVTYAKGDQESMSGFIEKTNFGEIVVEERMMKNEK